MTRAFRDEIEMKVSDISDEHFDRLLLKAVNLAPVQQPWEIRHIREIKDFADVDREKWKAWKILLLRAISERGGTGYLIASAELKRHHQREEDVTRREKRLFYEEWPGAFNDAR